MYVTFEQSGVAR